MMSVTCSLTGQTPTPTGTLLRRRLRSAVSVLTVCGVLAGCAQVKEVAGSVSNSMDALFSNYVDESDVCVAQRRGMVDSASLFDRQTMLVILGSAALGVTTAVVTGDVGAGIGVAAAALAGAYLTGMLKKGKSANEVTDTIAGDVNAANRRIDDVIASFKALDQCRKGEARQIRRDLNAGRISRTDAEARMAEVRRKRDEDVSKFKQLAENISEFKQLAENISESSASYASAYNEIAADNGRRGFDIAENGSITRGRGKATKQATDPGSLKGANGAKVDGLQRACLTNVRKRDDCFQLATKAEEDQGDFTI